MKRKKVWVVILNQGTISAGLESQLVQWMTGHREKYDFMFHPSKYTSRPIPSNRNMIVRDFLKTDADYLIMLDDDNPPNQDFFEMIDLDKDVIGVPTPGKGDAGVHWMVYDFKKGYPKKVLLEAFPFEKRKGIQKVGAISTGCVIIARRVLEALKRPFEDIFGDDGVILHSDDIGFAHKAKQAGFQEWANFEMNCSHYKTVDLLQMIAYSNLMYDKGYEDGAKYAKGIEVKPVKISDLIKKHDNGRSPKKASRDGGN